MFIALINHIALLTLLGLIHFLILKKYPSNTYRYQIYSGTLFGFLIFIIMMDNFVLSRSFLFDGRYMLVSVAALFGGPITAGIAVAIGCLYRVIFIGGDSTLGSIIIFLSAASLGLLFHQRDFKRRILSSYFYTYFLGLAINSIVLFWVYLLVTLGQSGEVFQVVTYESFLLFPIGTVILVKLLHDQEIFLQTAHELRISEGRYRGLFENNQAIMFVIDPLDGRIIDANPAACRFYGYDRSMFEQMKINQIDTLSFPEIQAEINKSIETQATCFLFKHRLASGEIRDVEVYGGTIHVQGKILVYSIVFDITDKKILEDQLKESEQQYRLLVESAPDGIFVQIDSKFAFMNKSLVQMLGGKTQEDFIGRSICDLFHPDLHEVVRERIRTLNEKKQNVGSRDFDIIGLDGRLIPMEFSGVPIHLNNQDGALVFVRNIKERVVQERLLKESEERFRKALSESPFPIAIHNEKGDFLFINKLWQELSGYSYSEIPTIDVWSAKVYGDRKEIVKKGMDALYQLEHRVDEGEFEIQTKTGEKRIWDFSTAPLGKDQDGSRMVISVAKDVTEHKKGEMQQQRLLTAIEQSQETFLITDTEGNILYVNPSFEKNTGYSSAESLGKTPRILKSGHHEESFYKNIWETITRGKTWSGRIINKKKDGSLYYDQTTISPVFDANGKIVNYVSVKRDVTHEIEMENQLYQSQKMESIGHLAGGVAHDFNNILTAILGYTDLARYKIKGDNDLNDDLKQIEKATLRAANLTRQLLAFSRKQILSPVIVDLNELILNLDKMLRRLIGEDIEYTTLPCEGLWKVKADIGQMEQVLTNLVVNARDAMPRGGNITIETQNAICDELYVKEHVEVPIGEYVMLAVSDTGTGIAKDLLNKIFDPFFTTKEKDKGTGLGLSTVLGIIKQSEGNIFVYSEEGHGTTFKIYLPRTVQESDASPIAHETPQSYLGTETVLLVEDEEMLRTLISKSLQNAGYKVLEASYASEAIELFEKNKYSVHILVTDVIMPKMSGKDLSQILVQKNSGLKVLYMSGYTTNAIVHHGILDEGVEFIQKPFIPKDLLLKIRSVLDR